MTGPSTGRRAAQGRPKHGAAARGGRAAAAPSRALADYVDGPQAARRRAAARSRCAGCSRMLRDYPREPLLAAVARGRRSYGLFDLDRLERMVLRSIATDYFVAARPSGDDEEDDDE